MKSSNESVQHGYCSKILNLLIPQPCPYPLIRVGGSGDGAYLLPNDLLGIEACFSPGVNNYKYFEDELALRHGIASHMCDFTSDEHAFRTPLVKGMQTFQKKWLAPSIEPDSITLSGWISQYSQSACSDLMLQMDIEGAEYPILLASDQSVLNRFRIIVLELHGLEALLDENVLYQSIGPAISHLSQSHICVHAHPNNCSTSTLDPVSMLNIPSVLEVTFLRKDRFPPNAPLFDPRLPHPRDIPYNVVHNPPVHLNNGWLCGRPQSYDSAIKIYRDQILQSSSVTSVLMMKALRYSRDSNTTFVNQVFLIASLSCLPLLIHFKSLFIIILKGARLAIGKILRRP
jgi:hypothetical protein